MILGIWGEDKSGKSTFALSAPKPLVYQEFDLGGFNRANKNLEKVKIRQDLEAGLIIRESKATEAWIGILEFDNGTIDECTNKPDRILSDRGIITWEYNDRNDDKKSKEYLEISKKHFKKNSVNSSQPNLFPNDIQILEQQSKEAKNFIMAIRTVLS